MTEPDALPNRSALFAIPPIVGPGAGTESLISYLVRVARAHQVKVRSLVREQIWSAVALEATSLHIPFFKEQARTVNGVGRYARAFAGALQALTSVQGLERLTFLPWQGVIPEVGTASWRRK